MRPSNMIIGANSGIAKALICLLLKDGQNVVGVSRGVSFLDDPLLSWHQCEASESGVVRVTKLLMEREVPLKRVVICTGWLHNQAFQPEKKLEELQMSQMERSFRVNCMLPLFWLSQLMPLLCNERQRQLPRVSITVLSARVGSIGDNRLGGWFSYRASKAALNMGLKSASIELARRASNTKLIAYHPGTTDTPLSGPFQARVPSEKLFSPAVTADRLLNVTDEVPLDGNLSFIDWSGQAVEW